MKKCPSVSPFERNSSRRSSTGTLKQPRLPRSDRFRFISSSSENLSFEAVPSTSPISKPRSLIHTKQRCYPDSARPKTVNGRSEHRRKPIIPISRQTCRVLNNTNVELSADTIEYIHNETANIDRICMDYITINPPNSSHSVEMNKTHTKIGLPLSSTYQDLAVTDWRTQQDYSLKNFCPAWKKKNLVNLNIFPNLRSSTPSGVSGLSFS